MRAPRFQTVFPMTVFLPDAFLTSTAVVALAEIGDKTQLLAIVLATRYRRPLPIIAGILVATIVNHFFSALIGSTAAGLLDSVWFRYAVAAGFVAMGLWTLVPDSVDDDIDTKGGRHGVFLTTLIAFFLVEMGDKTQVATIALGARYHDAVTVAAGTTLGMMLANVPAVFLGNEVIRRVPLALVRTVAAILFVCLGLWLGAKTAGLV